MSSSRELYAQANRAAADADAKARLAGRLRDEADAIAPALATVRSAMAGDVWAGSAFDRASATCDENIRYLHQSADEVRFVAAGVDRQAAELRQQADDLRRQAAVAAAAEPESPLVRPSGAS